MKIFDLLQCLNELAPLTEQEDWDCSGLTWGEPSRDLCCVATAVDCTPYVVKQALQMKADTLLVHHPPTFTAPKIFDGSCGATAGLMAAAQAGLSVISWHTPWDKAAQGVNLFISQLLGLTSVTMLLPSTEGRGLGAIGDLPNPLTVAQVGHCLAEKLELSGFRFWGEHNVSRVAICGGSGGEFFSLALSQGAQLFVSSEFKEHQIVEAGFHGLGLIECDHGEMEEPSMKRLGCLVEEMLGVQHVHVRGTVHWSPTYVSVKGR